MNVNNVLTKDYEKKTLSECGKNKAKTKPNKPKQSQFQRQKNAAVRARYRPAFSVNLRISFIIKTDS